MDVTGWLDDDACMYVAFSCSVHSLPLLHIDHYTSNIKHHKHHNHRLRWITLWRWFLWFRGFQYRLIETPPWLLKCLLYDIRVHSIQMRVSTLHSSLYSYYYFPCSVDRLKVFVFKEHCREYEVQHRHCHLHFLIHPIIWNFRNKKPQHWRKRHMLIYIRFLSIRCCSNPPNQYYPKNNATF